MKPGDQIPWDATPDGALVREHGPDVVYAVRHGLKGLYVGGQASWASWSDELEGRWSWVMGHGFVTIVALGLVGNETADELRQLVEDFEARRAAVNPRVPVAVVETP